MPAKISTRFGLNYGWPLGESGWNTGMDANLLKLDRVGVHLSVVSKGLTSPPVTAPPEGACYIIGGGATGEWATKDGHIAVRTGTLWTFYAPKIGWLAYVEDVGVLSVYKAAGWSAGLAI